MVFPILSWTSEDMNSYILYSLFFLLVVEIFFSSLCRLRRSLFSGLMIRRQTKSLKWTSSLYRVIMIYMFLIFMFEFALFILLVPLINKPIIVVLCYVVVLCFRKMFSYFWSVAMQSLTYDSSLYTIYIFCDQSFDFFYIMCKTQVTNIPKRDQTNHHGLTLSILRFWFFFPWKTFLQLQSTFCASYLVYMFWIMVIV